MKLTYEMSPDGNSITCKICGTISYNHGDVRHRYCATCHVFHDDLESCIWCDEPIMPSDRAEPITAIADGQMMERLQHWECAVRAVVGGVNHQRGLCTCCGGTADPDPPDMTRRQAAVAAAELWMKQYRTMPHACESETPEEIPPKGSTPERR